MAEPYVAIAAHTTYAALLTALEVVTFASDDYTVPLEAATTSALASQTTATTALAKKFDLLLLVGA